MQRQQIAGITCVVFIIVMFAITSGAINAAVEIDAIEQQWLLIPDRSVNTAAETTVGVLLLLCGLGGVMMLHSAAKYHKHQTKMFYFAFAIIFLTLMLQSFFLVFKFGMVT